MGICSEHSRERHSITAWFSAAQVMHKRHEHMIFYDCWVSRDASGLPFANNRPFVAHQYSRLRLEAGQPFPVSCCWNGMAVISAAPFRKGIRFRWRSSSRHWKQVVSVPESLIIGLGFGVWG